MLAFDGAITTSIRPHGPTGRPLADLSVSWVHVLPPSVDLWRPLPLAASGPSPPDRNVQLLRQKSHSPASIVSGFLGSSVTLAHPVDWLVPVRINDQVL